MNWELRLYLVFIRIAQDCILSIITTLHQLREFKFWLLNSQQLSFWLIVLLQCLGSAWKLIVMLLAKDAWFYTKTITCPQLSITRNINVTVDHKLLISKKQCYQYCHDKQRGHLLSDVFYCNTCRRLLGEFYRILPEITIRFS